MKICVCLGAGWQEYWPVYREKADLIEFRIDLMLSEFASFGDLWAQLAPILKHYGRKIIVTYRFGTLSPDDRASLFLSLLTQSPAYIDVEYDTPVPVLEMETKLIISFHHDRETPSLEELYTIVGRSFSYGADLVKIVCRCRDAGEEARLMALYKIPAYTGRLIVFGMGPYGLSSRLHAAALGTPILYAAPDGGAPTAPGQPRFSQLQAHLLNIM
ncbi:MAG: type I 3-dehydroquinate dehydratase [Bacteroidetes bacterium]|nr:type I 3-dehydroquinate dehydratase [Bacteroidota bacterium]